MAATVEFYITLDRSRTPVYGTWTSENIQYAEAAGIDLTISVGAADVATAAGEVGAAGIDLALSVGAADYDIAIHADATGIDLALEFGAVAVAFGSWSVAGIDLALELGGASFGSRPELVGGAAATWTLFVDGVEYPLSSLLLIFEEGKQSFYRVGFVGDLETDGSETVEVYSRYLEFSDLLFSVTGAITESYWQPGDEARFLRGWFDAEQADNMILPVAVTAVTAADDAVEIDVVPAYGYKVGFEFDFEAVHYRATRVRTHVKAQSRGVEHMQKIYAERV